MNINFIDLDYLILSLQMIKKLFKKILFCIELSAIAVAGNLAICFASIDFGNIPIVIIE